MRPPGNAAAAVDALDHRDVVLPRGNDRVGGWPRRSSRPTMSRRPRPPLITTEPPVPVRTRVSEEKAAGPHETGNQGQASQTWVKQRPCEGAPAPTHVPASRSEERR